MGGKAPGGGYSGGMSGGYGGGGMAGGGGQGAAPWAGQTPGGSQFQTSFQPGAQSPASYWTPQRMAGASPDAGGMMQPPPATMPGPGAMPPGLAGMQAANAADPNAYHNLLAGILTPQNTGTFDQMVQMHAQNPNAYHNYFNALLGGGLGGGGGMYGGLGGGMYGGARGGPIGA